MSKNILIRNFVQNSYSTNLIIKLLFFRYYNKLLIFLDLEADLTVILRSESLFETNGALAH